jgi:hypothetical protein
VHHPCATRAQLDVLHVGALLLGLLEAALWRAYQQQHPPQQQQQQQPTSVAAAKVPALVASPAVEPVRALRERVGAMRTFAASRRAAGDDSAGRATLEMLRADTSHTAVDKLLSAARCGASSADDGDGDDGWLSAVYFVPLCWCARFGAGAAAAACAARRRVEEAAAEEAAERLLLDVDAPTAGGSSVKAADGPKAAGGKAQGEACAGGDAGGSASEAKRRKKERQQQRKREQREAVAVQPAQASDVDCATGSDAPVSGGAAVQATGEGQEASDAASVASALMEHLLENCVATAAANAAARRRERQAQQRRRAHSVEVASSIVELVVSAALRDALRREKKRGKAELRRERAEQTASAATPPPPPLPPAPAALPLTSEAPLPWRVATGSGGGSHEPPPAYEHRCEAVEVGMAAWMSTAVGKLLNEMEQTRLEQTEGERASRRLLAIAAAESERNRRLLEMVESAREEEARRTVMRAAARAAVSDARMDRPPVFMRHRHTTSRHVACSATRCVSGLLRPVLTSVRTRV